MRAEPGPAAAWPLRAALAALGALLALPFLVPLHAWPIPSFRGEALAVACGLVAMALLAAPPLWRGLRIPLAAPALLLLAAAVGAQAAAGRAAAGELALIAAALLCWAALLATLGATLRAAADEKAWAGALAAALLAGSLLAAAAGWLQHYAPGLAGGWIFVPGETRAWGNLGQANHQASYLALGTAALGYLFAAGRLGGAAALALAGVLLGALALSGSRGAWLYLIGSAALAWLAARAAAADEARRLRRAAIALLPAFVLVQGLVLLLPAPPHAAAAPERLFALAAGWDIRWQLWREAWAFFLEAPLAGIGFGRFPWHHFLATAAEPGTAAAGLYGHPHNFVLHLLAELGGPVTAAVLAGLGWWLWRALTHPVGLALAFAVTVVGVILTHGLLEYPLWYAYFLGPAALFLGLADAKARQPRLPQAAAVLPAALAILGLVATAGLWRSHATLEGAAGELARARAASRGDEQALRRALEALDALRRESLLAPYAELELADWIALDRSAADAKLALNARVMAFAPTRKTAYREAALLALSGREAEALAAWRRAAAAYPEYAATFAAALGPLSENEPRLQALRRAISPR